MSSANPTTLELTETESRLRQLLLDVAAFIDETPTSEATVTGVQVPDALIKENVVLRFTGGWVRDKLLGVGSQDIDVAINKMTGEHFALKMLEYLQLPGNAEKYGLDAEEYAKSDGKGKNRKIAPGLHKIEANPDKSKHLETVTTKLMGIDLDLVNLRKETYNEVSRNPQMEFGTPEDDALRRDATVNAMFYNLNTSQIEDFTGRGFKDMEAKVIRTPLEPYQTFRDDPLRVLRLIRFASRLQYKIDAESEKAMGNEDIKEALKLKISRERVGIELEKMLKGPDPLMALELINRLGLYETVFVDPNWKPYKPYKPETDYSSKAYSFVQSLIGKSSSDVPSVIAGILLRNPEEQYLAWICAALMPWTDAPTVFLDPKDQKKFHSAAYTVSREGIKAPKKISDVISAAMKNGPSIRQHVADAVKTLDPPSRRASYGMAIRQWGPTWRTQVFFSITYELVLGSVSRDRIFETYVVFLRQLVQFDLLEAYAFKPLLTGTQLATALNIKPGPWMKSALDVVMMWQLRNPDVTDPTQAIEAVKDSRTSELPSRLAECFLQLTIRPLFSQTKKNPSSTLAEHAAEMRDHRPDNEDARRWKDPDKKFAVELLRWILFTLHSEFVEDNWRSLVPPITMMLDEIEIKWKVTGCELLHQFLSLVPPSLLKRHGLGDVFEHTLRPFFTYLPTLTPEQDSVALINETLPAMMELAELKHHPDLLKTYKDPAIAKQMAQDASLNNNGKNRALLKILREGILDPLNHASPTTYPELGTTILSHVTVLLRSMGLETVHSVHALCAVLSRILGDPFNFTHQELMITTVHALQHTILNGWPRIAEHSPLIMMGVAKAWWRCCQEDNSGHEDVGDLKEQLKEAVAMLDAVLMANPDYKEEWITSKRHFIAQSPSMRTLFEQQTDLVSHGPKKAANLPGEGADEAAE